MTTLFPGLQKTSDVARNDTFREAKPLIKRVLADLKRNVLNNWILFDFNATVGSSLRQVVGCPSCYLADSKVSGLDNRIIVCVAPHNDGQLQVVAVVRGDPDRHKKWEIQPDQDELVKALTEAVNFVRQ